MTTEKNVNWAGAALNVTLRRQQAEALQALTSKISRRNWVVLPPGAGKTLVGLEYARTLGMQTVVFSPNTAIQGQWVSAGGKFTPALPVSDSKNLTGGINSLTYQTLAAFKADTRDAATADRLGDSAVALLNTIASTGDVLVILDEAHHLLASWGEVIAEIVKRNPNVHLLGLTGTPPKEMSKKEADMFLGMLGDPCYIASSNALVRDGGIAPHQDIHFFVEPSQRELSYLAAVDSAAHNLVNQFTPITAMADIITAATTDEITALVANAAKGEHGDAAAALAVSAPIVTLMETCGYTFSADGYRKVFSPIDRICSHSDNKAEGAAAIITAEHANRGDDLRALVLCDFESMPSIPAEFLGEVTVGSCENAINVLSANPVTGSLSPVMLTGSRVRTTVATAKSITAWVKGKNPKVKFDAIPANATANTIIDITGNWDSSTWVPAVTDWYQNNNGSILIGTRALLGEGWDAPRVNVVVDLTSAATSVAVAQARGRGLRIDPALPGKVANIWTVTCVDATRLDGNADYDRLVRKAKSYFTAGSDGVAVRGDSILPSLVTVLSDMNAVNSKSLSRAAQKEAVTESWKIGQSYRNQRMAYVSVAAPTVPMVSIMMLNSLGYEIDNASLVINGRGAEVLQDAGMHSATQMIAGAIADSIKEIGFSPVGHEAVRVQEENDGSVKIWLDSKDDKACTLFQMLIEEAFSAPKTAKAPVATAQGVSVEAYATCKANASDRRVSARIISAAHPIPRLFLMNERNLDVFSANWLKWVGGQATPAENTVKVSMGAATRCEQWN